MGVPFLCCRDGDQAAHCPVSPKAAPGNGPVFAVWLRLTLIGVLAQAVAQQCAGIGFFNAGHIAKRLVLARGRGLKFGLRDFSTAFIGTTCL
jgi:hypothetical protein